MSGLGSPCELPLCTIKDADSDATTTNLNSLLASPNAELIIVLEIEPFQPDQGA